MFNRALYLTAQDIIWCVHEGEDTDLNDMWSAVTDELARWADEGRVARFWLRDDDAIEPTTRLDQFLDITGKYNIPVMLAVIPEHTKASLAERLLQSPHAAPVVHGWGHTNHAPKGEKSQELGGHRPHQIVINELAKGMEKLTNLFGPSLLPVLVPPWNRIDPNLLPMLPDIGFRAISAFGRKPMSKAVDMLSVINTNVDLIDWKGTRGCRNHDDLIVEIANELAESRAGDDRPIGLLTHHLVHDLAVTEFLDAFFQLVDRQQSATWVKAADLL